MLIINQLYKQSLCGCVEPAKLVVAATVLVSDTWDTQRIFSYDSSRIRRQDLLRNFIECLTNLFALHLRNTLIVTNIPYKMTHDNKNIKPENGSDTEYTEDDVVALETEIALKKEILDKK